MARPESAIRLLADIGNAPSPFLRKNVIRGHFKFFVLEQYDSEEVAREEDEKSNGRRERGEFAFEAGYRPPSPYMLYLHKVNELSPKIPQTAVNTRVEVAVECADTRWFCMCREEKS